MKREKIRKNIFLVLTIICIILTAVGVFIIVNNGVGTPGAAIIPLLIGLVCFTFYKDAKRNLKKENNK